MKYAKTIIDLIGDTPLVKLNSLAKKVKPTILLKLEYLNPGGSTKDRVGIAMIEDAEKKGLIKKGDTIVEPTSGNTGVALAIAAAIKGYKVIFTMSEKMSIEKELVLKAYGARVIRCPADAEPDDPKQYINAARIISEEMNAYFPNQYHNIANTKAHYQTTGPEIWNDTNGKITHYVAGMGTGGTISGPAKYLKEMNPKIKVIGVDPKGSLLKSLYYGKKDHAKAYKVEGPGEDFLPATMDFRVIDEVITVTDKQSFTTARNLVKREGIFAGGSSGLAVYGALQVAKKLTENDIIVVPLPDGGRSYISKIYDDTWMKENKFL